MIRLAVAQRSYSIGRKAFTPVVYNMFGEGFARRSFSAASAPPDNSVGSVRRKLKALDQSTVKLIYQDLEAVDKNSDGRLDHSELQQLLAKHPSAFSEEEIVEMSELFYAGRGGESVSFERFIEAIDKLEAERLGVAPWENNDFELKENPLGFGNCANEYMFIHRHHYTPEQLAIEQTHVQPESMRDRLAFQAVKLVRYFFDAATGWNNGKITPDKVLNRAIYLETIAAVPGMVAAVVRHFRSLRAMKRDGGMMHMFLDEANNERMHLLSFVQMKDPGLLFRFAVIGGQLGFGSAFLLTYVISPKFCHRFVGYIEEEACSTYTKIIDDIEASPDGTELSTWRTQRAPRLARAYWKLGENGSVLDMIYAVRADEAEHRDVNHQCTQLDDDVTQNPVYNTDEKMDGMLRSYVKDILQRTDEEDKIIKTAHKEGDGMKTVKMA